jgi:hypothetical protein
MLRASNRRYGFAYNHRVSVVGMAIFLFMLDGTSLLGSESVSELDTSLAGEHCVETI